jgi:hypothetical protein
VSRKQAFWENWFRHSHSLLTNINEFLTKLYTIWVKVRTALMPFSNYEFPENWHGKSHTLLWGQTPTYISKKVKQSCYSPGVAQRVPGS